MRNPVDMGNKTSNVLVVDLKDRDSVSGAKVNRSIKKAYKMGTHGFNRAESKINQQDVWLAEGSSYVHY